MLHGNEGSTQGGELCVCQVAVDVTDEEFSENSPTKWTNWNFLEPTGNVWDLRVGADVFTAAAGVFSTNRCREATMETNQLPEARPLPEQHRYLSLSNSCLFSLLKIVVCTTTPFWPSSPPLRTRPWGAGPAGRTASGRGRCTCCSSSGSHEPAGPGSGLQPPASSRSRRSSSPGRSNARTCVGEG